MLVSTEWNKIINRTRIEPGSQLCQYFPGKDIDVIATFGAVGDWAAYIGPRDMSDEWLRDKGMKLNMNEAGPLFPFMNIEYYRR